MKIVVYGPDKRTGLLADGSAIDLSYAYAKFLAEREGAARPVETAEALVPSDLMRLIETGPAALEKVRTSVDYLTRQAQDQNDPRGESVVHPIASVRLHAPHPKGARAACAGSNFITHRSRMTARSGREQEKPFLWGFWNVEKEFLGPDGDMIYPARCAQLDYEGEVAVVLGREGKDLQPKDLKDFVWGVSLCCDWSVRGPRERLGPMNFAPGKNFDTSMSLGPCIVVGELDATNVDFETYVNGERRQQGNTKEMVFSFGDYLQYLSRDMTLHPGDIIASGTPAGTVADSTPVGPDGTQPNAAFLKVGDKVEIRSPQTGALRARIVAKQAN